MVEINKDSDLYIKSAAFDRFVDFLTVMIEKYSSTFDIDENKQNIEI